MERMFKVAFRLPDDVRRWAPGGTELLWVEKADPGEGVVRNVPFYMPDIAFGDTVRVWVDHSARELVFDEVVRRSGNSTVRTILKSEDARQRLEASLTSHGCTWEIDSTTILWAIDVPMEVSYGPLRADLEELLHTNLIEVQEASISPKHEADLDQ